MNIATMPAAAFALVAALFALPVAAQQMKTVEGLVINIGIVNALMAEHADSQHGVHQGGHGAGVPDYSEVFDFGWSGKYVLRVSVTPKGAAKPVTTRFTVNHYIP
jgi:hypothetical protein